MMEEPARGRRYEYMRDINVTIAADGRDVKSGYTFTFGGFRNTRSAILRGATVLVEVADASARIPTSMIIHQNWYRIHVEREGHRLSYRVSLKDNPVLSLDCEDPDPLDGDRMAIWAYDCGVMVARLRIAADSVGEPESPDFEAPEVPKTMYDVAPDAASGQENR